MHDRHMILTREGRWHKTRHIRKKERQREITRQRERKINSTIERTRIIITLKNSNDKNTKKVHNSYDKEKQDKTK